LDGVRAPGPLSLYPSKFLLICLTKDELTSLVRHLMRRCRLEGETLSLYDRLDT
jgi:hypothetical protein